MSKPLIPVGQLISEGFDLFKANWRPLVRVTLWMLLGIAVYALGAVGAAAILIAGQAIVAAIIFILSLIAMIAVSVWVTIRLSTMLLEKSRGKAMNTSSGRAAWVIFWPFIWIGLASYLATLGGFILLIIPGIWLTVAFSFAPYILLEDNVRGLKALGASADLVKGRWWGVLGRGIVIGLVFLGIAIALMIVTFIITFIIGLILGIIGLEPGVGESVGAVIGQLIQFAITLVLTPLSIAFQVRLFHSLKDTR